MGYSVNRLVTICTGMNGDVMWENNGSDIILKCDRTDPLTKSAVNARWLIHPAIVDGQQIAVLTGASTNGITLSREELEYIASSIPNDPQATKPSKSAITVPVND
jgi:hypothetical protein